MKFIPLSIQGAFLVEPEPYIDSRGIFARTFCQDEFERVGLDTRIAQCSTSFNPLKGTLRGMHFQRAPFMEAKIVRCTRGAAYDVIADPREGSSSYLRWQSISLTEVNRCSLYVPQGVAHGFLTLEPNTEMFYQMTEFHHPECATTIRWDDPLFGISWPEQVTAISESDFRSPNFCP